MKKSELNKLTKGMILTNKKGQLFELSNISEDEFTLTSEDNKVKVVKESTIISSYNISVTHETSIKEELIKEEDPIIESDLLSQFENDVIEVIEVKKGDNKKDIINNLKEKKDKKEKKEHIRSVIKKEGYITVKEISEEFNLSQKYIRNIIRKNDIKKSEALHNKGYAFKNDDSELLRLKEILKVSAKNKVERQKKKEAKLNKELCREGA